MKLNEVLSKEGIIFLTGPFTNPDPMVEANRSCAIAKVANKLMNLRYIVFSPVSQNNFIDLCCNPEFFSTPDDDEYWNGFAEAFLKVSAALVILNLEGADKSKGLEIERNLAGKHRVRGIWIDEELNVLLDSAARTVEVVEIIEEEEAVGIGKVEDEKINKLIKLQNRFHNTVQKEVKKIDKEERPSDILRNPKLKPLHLNENLKTR